MTKINQNPIFNPAGDDLVEQRTIIKGNTTGLFQLNNTKYNWANSLYTVMIGNFWIPEKVSGLGEDSVVFKKELSEGEQRAYKGILSFLIFLDSIQTVNLPNFNDYITAPEVNLILSIQAYQEAIHSQSYATILESVVESKVRDEIYYFWRDDEILLERNKFIGGIYQDFIDNPSEKNLFRGIIGNYLLEGLYFYNGFAFFDTLADQAKMVATDRMINYIRRDELTHVTLFSNIIREIKKEFPEIYDEKLILDMMRTAVEQEIKWSKHIIAGSVIGMSDINIENYTKWLANQRLTLLGIDALYPEVITNPFKHLDRLQDNNSEKGNFFESTVTNYTQSSSMKGGWDF
ncbi:MAG: ribonucleotide-diphosphate reductase subunit beta [Candidatus Gracilibacteria bacterium]|nr:ribonucleotide-diphosphate reductase subunit beta [Candidatus Gracilibacteria bacterium]